MKNTGYFSLDSMQLGTFSLRTRRPDVWEEQTPLGDAAVGHQGTLDVCGRGTLKYLDGEKGGSQQEHNIGNKPVRKHPRPCKRSDDARTGSGGEVTVGHRTELTLGAETGHHEEGALECTCNQPTSAHVQWR